MPNMLGKFLTPYTRTGGGVDFVQNPCRQTVFTFLEKLSGRNFPVIFH
jgi:hypothetical protein